MNQSRLKYLVALVVIGLVGTLGASVSLAQESDGGPAVGDVAFEDGFEDWQDANQRVENDWNTWSLHDCQLENIQGDFDALCGSPEYKQANPMNAYPYRTHSGQNAQQYHTVHQGHHAGVWRRFEAKPGSVIEVHAWGTAWSTRDHDPHAYDPAQEVRMKIGVDPDGGSSPSSASIVWGPPANPPNQWQELAPVTVTVGDGGKVSVFLSSDPKYPLPHNDIYWDDVYAIYKSVDVPEAEDEDAGASGGSSGSGASGGTGNTSAPSTTGESAPAPDPILEGMVEPEEGGHPARGGDAHWLWVPAFALVLGAYIFFVPRDQEQRVKVQAKHNGATRSGRSEVMWR